MRILDIEGNELQEEDIDLENGYLEDDQIFIAHHDAIEEQPRQFHYVVKTIYFEDNTQMTIEDEFDPHIIIIDQYKGIFRYKNLEGEDPKVVRGMELKEITDVPAQEAKEAWDEYEDIKRYKLYTEEEKEARQQAQEQQARYEELINSGLGRIENLETSLTEYTANNDIRVSGLENTQAAQQDNIDEQIRQTNTDLQSLTETVSWNGEILGTTTEKTNETALTVDDLTLIIADIVGGEEL